MWSVISAVIVGAVIGALARLVLPGKQRISTLVTVVLGVIGSLIGSWAYTAISGNETTSGIDWIAFVLGIAAAALLIVVYGTLVGRTQA